MQNRHFVRPLLIVITLATLLLLSVRRDSATSAAQNASDDIAAKPQRADVHALMEKKLKAAQLAVEGVMKNDFEMVQESSAMMVELSRQAAWKQLASPSYIQDTADFVAAAEFLSRMAEAKDAEGVTLGFMKLTLNCSVCHQHVRTPRVALHLPTETEKTPWSSRTTTSSAQRVVTGQRILTVQYQQHY